MTEEQKMRVREGVKKGFENGRLVWNKGKKGVICDPNYKEHLALGRYKGKKLSDEVYKKISETVRAHWKNGMYSDHGKKIKEAYQKGCYNTDAYRKTRGQKKGRTFKDVTKQKIANTVKKNWEKGIHNNLGRAVSEGFKLGKYNTQRFKDTRGFIGKQCYYEKKDGKKIRLKSTWELAYAKYLDSKNIEWEYEPKGFY